MQESCGNGGSINADFGQDARNVNRVNKIRLTAQTQLPAVLFLGKGICALDQRFISVGMIMQHACNHLLQRQAFINGSHQGSPP